MTDTSVDSSDASGEWLWHSRHTKAYYPVATDDDRIVLVSAWHPDELADARDSGALVPVDEVGFDGIETTFDLLGSFRFLDDETLAALREAVDA